MYIYTTLNKKPAECKDINETIKKALPKQKEGVIMTFAEILRDEGRNEGIQIGVQRGEQLGMHKTLMTTISSKFDYLPDDIAQKIQSINNEENLLFLTQKAVKCDDLSEYRGVLNSI